MSKEKLEKLDMKSVNFREENIAKIAQIFPNVVSEDENGKVIDFDALKQELSDNIVDGYKERYSLNWPGKREAQLSANTPTNKTLRPCKEESVDFQGNCRFDNTENLYIEGDNLEVLKILQESYLNKIKMIYIDPPYNTGKDFVYNDNFSKSVEEELIESGQRDIDGGRLTQNLESNGRYHSDWLSMMYSRLKLSRNLLNENGVIFISIDDNEIHNLKKVCDEVFGENNCVNQFIWLNNSAGRQIQGSGAATTKEYILCYAKEINKVQEFLIKGTYAKEIMPDIYKGFNFEVKEDDIGKYITTHELNNGNSMFNEITRPNLVFDIFYNPTTMKVETGDMNSTLKDGFTRVSPKQIANGTNKFYAWRWSRDKVKNESYNLDFVETKNGWKVFTKRRDYDETVLKDMITNLTTLKGSNDLSQLGLNKIFDYPKPIDLIRILINSVMEEDDIILDFFSGSATSAHAIMKHNSEDNGNRKFIMVQLPEITDEKSEAYKAGYKNICEIGKERIRRAGEKIVEENGNRELDIGFRVLKLDSSNMKDVYFNPSEISQNILDHTVDNIKDDRSELDLLFGVLIDWGVDLTLPITKETIKGKDCYFVDEDSLCACFENDLDEEFIKELASRDILRVVFRDSGFASDDVKDNVSQIFKQLNENCDIKVI